MNVFNYFIFILDLSSAHCVISVKILIYNITICYLLAIFNSLCVGGMHSIMCRFVFTRVTKNFIGSMSRWGKFLFMAGPSACNVKDNKNHVYTWIRFIFTGCPKNEGTGKRFLIQINFSFHSVQWRQACNAMGAFNDQACGAFASPYLSTRSKSNYVHGINEEFGNLIPGKFCFWREIVAILSGKLSFR